MVTMSGNTFDDAFLACLIKIQNYYKSLEPKTDMERLVGINLNKPIIHVNHSDLERSDENSMFRSNCPECKVGILLVARDKVTFKIIPYDRCTLCGQSFYYDDYEKFNNQ